MKKERREYAPHVNGKMPAGMARTHANCKQYTGVFRPGKTAKDHAKD